MTLTEPVLTMPPMSSPGAPSAMSAKPSPLKSAVRRPEVVFALTFSEAVEPACPESPSNVAVYVYEPGEGGALDAEKAPVVPVVTLLRAVVEASGFFLERWIAFPLELPPSEKLRDPESETVCPGDTRRGDADSVSADGGSAWRRTTRP